MRERSYEVRLALRFVEHARVPSSEGLHSDRDVLEVAASGHWFRAPSERRVDCGRHRALHLLLLRLAEERLIHPGSVVASRDLVEAGWPKQRILEEAARNRLKVAMSSLRKLGLRRVLVHAEGGYLLDPNVNLVIVS